MDALPPRMLLRTTLTSPYGRKVRMAAQVLGLADRFDIEPADTRDPADSLRTQNPLGKIPCLMLPDGRPIFDSRVIIEMLDTLSGANRMLPPGGLERFVALARAEMADGIADAALLMVYEPRFRTPEKVSQDWLDHQAGKIERGLAVFSAELPDPGRTDLVSISLACALGYMDWRQPVDWRAMAPKVAGWLDDFAAAEPAFAATAAP